MHCTLYVLVLPRLHTRQQSLSVTFSIQTHTSTHFNTFQLTGKIISGGCTKSHTARLSDALGSDAVEPLVGCTQMDADMSGLLQRMCKIRLLTWPHALHTLRFGLTPPPHEAAIAKCDLNPNTHIDAFRYFPTLRRNHIGRMHKILSGARSFAARMHWRRMQSNAFGRLHSNECKHD